MNTMSPEIAAIVNNPAATIPQLRQAIAAMAPETPMPPRMRKSDLRGWADSLYRQHIAQMADDDDVSNLDDDQEDQTDQSTWPRACITSWENITYKANANAQVPDDPHLWQLPTGRIVNAEQVGDHVVTMMAGMSNMCPAGMSRPMMPYGNHDRLLAGLCYTFHLLNSTATQKLAEATEKLDQGLRDLNTGEQWDASRGEIDDTNRQRLVDAVAEHQEWADWTHVALTAAKSEFRRVMGYAWTPRESGRSRPETLYTKTITQAALDASTVLNGVKERAKEKDVLTGRVAVVCTFDKDFGRRMQTTQDVLHDLDHIWRRAERAGQKLTFIVPDGSFASSIVRTFAADKAIPVVVSHIDWSKANVDGRKQVGIALQARTDEMVRLASLAERVVLYRTNSAYQSLTENLERAMETKKVRHSRIYFGLGRKFEASAEVRSDEDIMHDRDIQVAAE